MTGIGTQFLCSLCELGRYLAAFCDRLVSEPGHESVLNPMRCETTETAKDLLSR